MFGRLNKNIGFSLVIFAFVFLFEPSYALIDPLPDFFGYFIICFALCNIGDIYPRIQEATVGFRRAAYISIARFASVIIINKFFIGQEQSVGILLFLTIFSTLELITVFPAYKKLFEGLLHLGIFNDGTAVYAHRERAIKRKNKISGEITTLIKKSRKNYTEQAYSFTAIFLVVKSFAAILPEFTSLYSNEKYEFIGMLRALFIVVALPVSVIWLIKMIRYFKSLSTDKIFVDAMSKKFLSHLEENKGFYTVRRIAVGMLLFSTTYLLSFDIYSDGINILPDCLFYVFLIFSIIFLSCFSKKYLFAITVPLIGTFISLYFGAVEKSFAKCYDYTMITKDIDAYYAYYKVFYARIAEAIVFLICVILTLLLLWSIYKSHSDLERARDVNEIKKEKSAFILRAAGVLAITLFAVASRIFFIYAQPYYYDAWYYSDSLVISYAVNIIFLNSMIYFNSFIKKAAERRYKLDL